MQLPLIDRLILVMLSALMLLFLVRLALQVKTSIKVEHLADLQIAQITKELD